MLSGRARVMCLQRLKAASLLIGLVMTGDGSAAAQDLNGSHAAGERPNILFIAIDDLRPELGCYGVEHVQSPQIDQLAADGVLFSRAYCQFAVCNASRASIMTGLRPDSVKVWDLLVHFRDLNPEVVTLPQHFRDQGYYAAAYGKIFHNPLPDRRSWDEPNHWPEHARTWSVEGRERLAEYREKMRADGRTDAAIRRMRAPATDDEDVADNVRPDGEIAEQATEAMRRMADGEQPFFLAVGFIRPHLPFVPPRRYWDLYDRDAIALAPNPVLPADVPAMAMNTMYELRDYMDFAGTPTPDQGALSDEQQRLLKHGYLACVSYVDNLVGGLLAELDRLGLRENTIVVLWSDHGWKLGEHRSWCKQTNFEIDARVPLIVRAPQAEANGEVCSSLVELVDVYPTLCELAGVPQPGHIEGTSLAPLLDDVAASGKQAVFHQYRRRHAGSEYMGYAMRTDRYRIVDWIDWKTGESEAVELYDLLEDPEESGNLAGSAEYSEIVDELRDQMSRSVPPRKLQDGDHLRSLKSTTAARLTVTNSLAETVAVYWIDLRGGRQHQQDIEPGEAWSVETFLKHVFVCESDSGEFHRIVSADEPDTMHELALDND